MANLSDFGQTTKVDTRGNVVPIAPTATTYINPGYTSPTPTPIPTGNTAAEYSQQIRKLYLTMSRQEQLQIIMLILIRIILRIWGLSLDRTGLQQIQEE